MITGPILPRTRAGLWSLLAQHEDRIERGLVVLETDLQLDERARVDALARDALGHPVLMFGWLAGEDDDLPLRVLDALAWFQRNVPLLRESLVLPGLRVEREPRALVLGFDLASTLVEKLSRLREPRLEAYEFRAFATGGAMHVGVVPVLGPALSADEHSFRAPSGVTEPRHRTLCVRFLERMQKLDPGLQVLGDRYARRLRLDGVTLVELRVGIDGPEVGISRAEGPPQRLALCDDETLAVGFDAAMRRYLELLDLDQPEETQAAVPAEQDHEASRLVSPRPESRLTERAGQRLASEALRRSALENHLTKEELSALSGPAQ